MTNSLNPAPLNEMIQIVTQGLAARRIDKQDRDGFGFPFGQIVILHEGRTINVQIESMGHGGKPCFQLFGLGRVIPQSPPLLFIPRRCKGLKQADQELKQSAFEVGPVGDNVDDGVGAVDALVDFMGGDTKWTFTRMVDGFDPLILD